MDRLLALKSRSVNKGLILIADNIRQFDFLFEDFPELWLDRMASTWPGPNTWLVPHQGMLPEWITGVHDTGICRIPEGHLEAGTTASHGRPGDGARAGAAASRGSLAGG